VSGVMDILCAGELLVDCVGGREFPGGAPANVAYHAAALGLPVGLITRVGDDERGRKLREWLHTSSIDDSLLQTDRHQPTGVVEVTEEPRYTIAASAAWDFIEPPAGDPRAVRVFVCGTLAQRHPVSRGTIREWVRRVRQGGGRVLVDLNLRAPFFDEEVVLWSLRHADVLKLNLEELAVVSQMLGAQGESTDLFTGLLREFGIGQAVLTCGPDGAWFNDDGRLWRQPAVPVEVIDTVGAGDAFCAVLAAALARGTDLRKAAPICAKVAAFVASQPGATPRWTEKFEVPKLFDL
jgi:fructokinase